MCHACDELRIERDSQASELRTARAALSRMRGHSDALARAGAEADEAQQRHREQAAHSAQHDECRAIINGLREELQHVRSQLADQEVVARASRLVKSHALLQEQCDSLREQLRRAEAQASRAALLEMRLADAELRAPAKEEALAAVGGAAAAAAATAAAGAQAAAVDSLAAAQQQAAALAAQTGELQSQLRNQEALTQEASTRLQTAEKVAERAARYQQCLAKEKEDLKALIASYEQEAHPGQDEHQQHVATLERTIADRDAEIGRLRAELDSAGNAAQGAAEGGGDDVTGGAGGNGSPGAAAAGDVSKRQQKHKRGKKKKAAQL
eukprot:TRINITY_DN110_c0_g1_i2.p1 TRINITY_DN110_c0_g1~~TRINITY_DN110_c0_g1_i2.p1  ORF type:complete len:325 (-),score=118.68 TRINITY_DN110_c0_g1_i2:1462-2436(-)